MQLLLLTHIRANRYLGSPTGIGGVVALFGACFLGLVALGCTVGNTHTGFEGGSVGWGESFFLSYFYLSGVQLLQAFVGILWRWRLIFGVGIIRPFLLLSPLSTFFFLLQILSVWV